MEKITLPPIAAEAKRKPLSYNPQSGEFIYYDKVANGEQRIYPISRLEKSDRILLAIKRYQCSEEDLMVSSLNGETYSKQDIVSQIEKQTPVGQSFLLLDLNYLEYFLSTFPKSVFS
ncbi:hypothetical protein [Algoriphagus confluentis]|uniref:Uncharacterized protein n=1 Tax=Algoriphagus confluentis TaxID=1697556 RepID=A0ABQ6PK07_9BACT|nr:hypothetical protein Aconfl_01970 [Algoriphagus confluentis]